MLILPINVFELGVRDTAGTAWRVFTHFEFQTFSVPAFSSVLTLTPMTILPLFSEILSIDNLLARVVGAAGITIDSTEISVVDSNNNFLCILGPIRVFTPVGSSVSTVNMISLAPGQGIRFDMQVSNPTAGALFVSKTLSACGNAFPRGNMAF